MSTPVLVFGLAAEVLVAQAGQGYLDVTAPYTVLAHTNRSAPAGLGGECAFYNLYFSTRHFLDPVILLVSVVVDGVQLTAQTLPLSGGADTGTQLEHELSLMQPYYVGGVEKLRYAPRGTRIEVVVAVQGALAAVDVGGVEVEYEIVRESRAAVTG